MTTAAVSVQSSEPPIKKIRHIRLNDSQRDKVGFVGLRASVGFFFMVAGNRVAGFRPKIKPQTMNSV